MAEQIVEKKEDIQRIPTHVKGLDEALQGGIPEGHITLIAGSAGTMKSSLSFNILYHEALENKKTGLYISLEQSYSSLINHFINMDYDLSKINLVVIRDLSDISKHMETVNNSSRGNLIIVDVGCIRKEIGELEVEENRSWLNVIKNIIKKIKRESKVDLFTLDSLSSLHILSKFKNPRVEMFYVFEFLRDLGITSFMLTETDQDGTYYGKYNEDFLSDGIINITLTSYRRKQVREIKIIKMRTTDCNHDTHSLVFRKGKFHAEFGGQNPLM